MEFKDFLSDAEKSMSESAQLKLDLITKINAALPMASDSVLNKLLNY